MADAERSVVAEPRYSWGALLIEVGEHARAVRAVLAAAGAEGRHGVGHVRRRVVRFLCERDAVGALKRKRTNSCEILSRQESSSEQIT